MTDSITGKAISADTLISSRIEEVNADVDLTQLKAIRAKAESSSAAELAQKLQEFGIKSAAGNDLATDAWVDFKFVPLDLLSQVLFIHPTRPSMVRARPCFQSAKQHLEVLCSAPRPLRAFGPIPCSSRRRIA